MTLADVAVLACPDCRGALGWEGRSRGGRLEEGRLRCIGCETTWPVAGGIPRLYREQGIRGPDRLLRAIYDGLPALHDPLTTVLTPWMQGETESVLRERYMRRLELASLAPRPGGGRPRILEIGIGAGANLPRVARRLPRGVEAEVWGVDLSAGMLARCRRRIAREGHRGVRLLQADAHALPFPDHAFDRVFEIGGINGYRDPRRALAEVARVARPGTPIVVVDEQLDPRARSLRDRVLFRLLTFYAQDARCPRELLPPGVTDVREEQLSRYYFCLTFRAPRTREVSPPLVEHEIQ